MEYDKKKAGKFICTNGGIINTDAKVISESGEHVLRKEERLLIADTIKKSKCKDGFHSNVVVISKDDFNAAILKMKKKK